MGIYLPCLHVDCSNDYSNNNNKEFNASSLANGFCLDSLIFKMPLQAGCYLSLFYKENQRRGGIVVITQGHLLSGLGCGLVCSKALCLFDISQGFPALH